MKKYNPPVYFKNIAASRIWGYLSIKTASELLGISDTTYLKYENLYRMRGLISRDDILSRNEIKTNINHEMLSHW